MAKAWPTLLRKLEENLTCPVCLELYDDPQLLVCQHTLCKKCTEELSQKGKGIHCPKCREVSKLEKITRNLTMRQMVEVYKQANQPEKLPLKCALCEEKRPECHCNDCKRLLCGSCQKVHLKLSSCAAENASLVSTLSEQTDDEIAQLVTEIQLQIKNLETQKETVSDAFSKQESMAVAYLKSSQLELFKVINAYFSEEERRINKEIADIKNRTTQEYDEDLIKIHSYSEYLAMLQNSDNLTKLTPSSKTVLEEIKTFLSEIQLNKFREILTVTNEDSNVMAFDKSKAASVKFEPKNALEPAFKDGCTEMDKPALSVQAWDKTYRSSSSLDLDGQSEALGDNPHVSAISSEAFQTVPTHVFTARLSTSKPMLRAISMPSLFDDENCDADDRYEDDYDYYDGCGCSGGMTHMSTDFPDLFCIMHTDLIASNTVRVPFGIRNLLLVDGKLWCLRKQKIDVFHHHNDGRLTHDKSLQVKFEDGWGMTLTERNHVLLATHDSGLLKLDQNGTFLARLGDEKFDNVFCGQKGTIYALHRDKSNVTWIYVYGYHSRNMLKRKSRVKTGLPFDGCVLTSVAINDDIYICLREKNSLVKVSIKSGKVLKTYGQKATGKVGDGQGKLYHPALCGKDDCGRLLIADQGKDRLQIFHPTTEEWLVLKISPPVKNPRAAALCRKTSDASKFTLFVGGFSNNPVVYSVGCSTPT